MMSAPTTPVASPEAAAAAAHAKTVRDQQTLRDAQNANARSNKLEKLARKDPAIRDLLEEHRATAGTVASLRSKVSDLELDLATARADAAQARDDAANLSRELTELRATKGKK